MLKCVVTTTALAHHCLHHDFREPLMLAGLRRLELWGGAGSMGVLSVRRGFV